MTNISSAQDALFALDDRAEGKCGIDRRNIANVAEKSHAAVVSAHCGQVPQYVRSPFRVGGLTERNTPLDTRRAMVRCNHRRAPPRRWSAVKSKLRIHSIQRRGCVGPHCACQRLTTEERGRAYCTRAVIHTTRVRNAAG